MTTSPLDRAILLAGHAVSYAEAFLAQRIDAEQLKRSAEQLELDLMALPEDPAIPALVHPMRMLANTLSRTAAAALVLRAAQRAGENGLHANATFLAGRLVRWEAVMAAFAEMVRHECRSFAKPAPRETSA